MWRLYFRIRNWLNVEIGMEASGRVVLKGGESFKEGDGVADFNVKCPNKQGK
jgi:hypothetical protein